MRFDLFCRVIDNHGDLGVCWRLSADLAGRGHRVRLFVDDARALAWMAPHGHAGVAVHPWPDDAAAGANEERGAAPPDVVIEAFGCDLPASVIARMAERMAAPMAVPMAAPMAPTREAPVGRPPCPPVWLNLEYLSAEPVVERLHGLPSPQLAGPGRGLPKWFFYPGFTAATGGLLREPDLFARQQRFDAAAWRAAKGIELQPGEACVSVFCYPDAPLPALLDALSDAPTLLLLAPGEAAARLLALLGPDGRRGPVRAATLPWLSQVDYDHLLWACDLNVVRGEDSFVRAQWAGRPMLWQIYPQHDGAHAAKLAAFLDRMLAGADPSLAAALAGAQQAFNRIPGAPGLRLPPWRSGLPPAGAAGAAEAPLPAGAARDPRAWPAHARAWCHALSALPDLTASLTAFAARAL